MSRYIDADALIEAMGEEPYVWTDSDDEIAECNQWLTDMHIIESAPSIDIVFCKECKHRESCCRPCYKSADSYCSDGERREP